MVVGGGVSGGRVWLAAVCVWRQCVQYETCLVCSFVFLSVFLYVCLAVCCVWVVWGVCGGVCGGLVWVAVWVVRLLLCCVREHGVVVCAVLVCLAGWLVGCVEVCMGGAPPPPSPLCVWRARWVLCRVPAHTQCISAPAK